MALEKLRLLSGPQDDVVMLESRAANQVQIKNEHEDLGSNTDLSNSL
jgi:hypothetical protein